MKKLTFILGIIIISIMTSCNKEYDEYERNLCYDTYQRNLSSIESQIKARLISPDDVPKEIDRVTRLYNECLGRVD